MTPVAGLIVVRPGIEVNTVEGDALHADPDGGNSGPYVAVESVLVHPEIRGRVPQADEARHV
jgi:hypothetical protein